MAICALAADAMFLQPSWAIMQPPSLNTVEMARLVVGIEINGEARAYPVRFIGYHHQVRGVGITFNGNSRAYDWNRLFRERVVNDEVGGQPIVLVLAPDSASFFAYQRPDADTSFALVADRLVAADGSYTLGGRGDPDSLTPVCASQEF